MGRNEESSRPVKPRKRGRNKLMEFKPQLITFSCIFCNESFATTNCLFDHMRSTHPNLCNIPQITADSEIVEEISGAKEKPVAQRIITESPANTPISEKYLSEDEEEASVDHLIEEVDDGEDMVSNDQKNDSIADEEEEEIESPPFERNSDAGSTCSEKEENLQPPMDTQENFQGDDNDDDEDDDDADDYLSLMEPICELNESEGEESKLNVTSVKINGRQPPKPPGRGRRIDQEQSEALPPGEGFFQCTVCNSSFHFAGQLAKHVRSHTRNKPYQCSICDKSFTHIGSLNTHLRIHRGEKPYKCDKCEKAFTQSSSLMVHLKSHLSKKPISCQICEKGFMNAISLQLHMKCHQGEEELFSCPKCDKKFKQEQMLADHVRVHTQHLFQCSICRLQLPTGSDLVQHLKSHTGDKPFQCSICSKSFTQPGSLSTHTRIHTGEKPHQCPDCDKSFTQASSLSVHIKIHRTTQKPFYCHICERSYSQQAYFNKHMSYHQQDQEQDKVAQCPLCNIVIVDAKKMMIKHFNKFHYDKKNKSFLCSICNERFDDPSFLVVHVRVHFPVAESAEVVAQD